MYIIEDNKFVNVQDNPLWCNNKGEPCHRKCTVIWQETASKDDKCEYYYTPKYRTDGNHNTFWEQRHYDKLGSYSWIAGTTTRLSLLRQAYENFHKRTKWGKIDAKIAEKYLRKLIIKEERK